MTGYNAQLFMDGELLQGVRSVKIEVSAGQIAILTVEFLGEIYTVGNFNQDPTPKKGA
jgi:hypothetical protein